MSYRIIQKNAPAAGSCQKAEQPAQEFELAPGQSVDLAPGEVVVATTEAFPAAVMYWDGADRAITPRDKTSIEEHRASCFSIPLVPLRELGDAPQAQHGGTRCVALTPGGTAGSTGHRDGLSIAHLGQLPPLPEPQNMGFMHDRNRSLRVTGFSASQMQGYARAALAAQQSPAHLHPDDLAVDAFAAAMKEKMAAARAKGRGGWDDKTQCCAADLSRLLREHMDRGDPRDVASFCMMLHQRGEAITARPPIQQQPAFYLRACDVQFIEERHVNQVQVMVWLEKPTASAVAFYSAQPAPADEPISPPDSLAATTLAVTGPEFTWSLDEELFQDRVDSIHAAIAAAVEYHGGELGVGRTIYVGEVVPVAPLQLIDADSVVDDIATRAYDLVGESADGYLAGVTKEQEAELETMIAAWANRVEVPAFWQVGKVVQHVLTAEDLGETCESGLPECAPATRQDSEGVRLCQGCWEPLQADDLVSEGSAAPEVGDVSRG